MNDEAESHRLEHRLSCVNDSEHMVYFHQDLVLLGEIIIVCVVHESERDGVAKDAHDHEGVIPLPVNESDCSASQLKVDAEDEQRVGVIAQEPVPG